MKPVCCKSEPRYGQAKFQEDEMSGKWRTVVSPDGEDNSLWIHQQAWFSLGDFNENSTVSYQLKKTDNVVYLFLISGKLEVGTETLNQRDAICIEQIEAPLLLKTNKKSKILLMEIPE
jgi:redox-sensitive bicupin YhaK (pirin superfamily)